MTSEVARKNLDTLLFEGSPMTLAEALRHLRLSGRWSSDVLWLSRVAAIPRMAKEQGLNVTDQELQGAIDEFRRANRLHSAADTETWMAGAGITLDDLESHLEVRVLAFKLKDRIPATRIDAYVRSNASSFPAGGPDAETRKQIVDVLFEEDILAFLERCSIRERPIWG